jgi:type II secretory pathway pseudopilin PulG
MLRFAAGSERKLRGVRDGAAMGLDGRAPEQGFVLVGLIVAIFFILLALSIAAPTVAKELKRERELETIHRGNQYVRAIQLYYKKSGGYPASMELLGKSNNVRYLRQQYVDPMTGKADWRLIHIGEAKTTVKGFFGKALPGMAPGLGTAAGMASSGGIGTGAAGASGTSGTTGGPGFIGSTPGSSPFGGADSGATAASPFGSSSSGDSSGSGSSGASALGSSSLGANSSGPSTATGSTAGGTTSTGTDSSGTSGSGIGSSNGLPGQTTSPGSSSLGSLSSSGSSGMPGGAPFVGVGLPKHADSIIVLNEQKTYQTWEFIYDPRVEQMKAGANILGGGGPVGESSGGLGSASSLSSGGTGSSSSGFGSGSSSGFGNSSGGIGSSPSGSSGFGSSSFGSSGNSGSSGSTPQSTQTPQ